MHVSSAKRIAILCNGSQDCSEKMRSRIIAFPLIDAVDGGAQYCQKLRLKPHLIIGDLDSCSSELLAFFSDVPCKRFPRDKDKTDLELALDELIHAETEEITLFGSLGKRIDHTLGNIILLSRYPGRLYIEDEHFRLFVINKEVTLSCLIGQLVSLIPLNGSVTGIYTEGLKWKLSDATLDKNFIGISNCATNNQIRITVGHGDLLCCLNNRE